MTQTSVSFSCQSKQVSRCMLHKFSAWTNLSADNLKKILDLKGSTPVRSGDTGQRISCFDSCQLVTTLMCNMRAISVFLCSQTSYKVWDWTLVVLWCGRTVSQADGRAVGVRSRDYQIFSEFSPAKKYFDISWGKHIKERLKRQCCTPYSYFTSTSSWYPQTFVSTKDSDHPKLRPPKTNELTNQQVREMRNWRAIYGHSVPKKQYEIWVPMNSRNSPNKSVCSGPTKRPATWFDQIRRPSITTFATGLQSFYTSQTR